MNYNGLCKCGNTPTFCKCKKEDEKCIENKIDLSQYNTKPIDYTGCDTVIAEALQQGLSIECIWGNEFTNQETVEIINYLGPDYDFPYLTKKLTKVAGKDLTPIKKQYPCEKFLEDAKAGKVAVDTKVMVMSTGLCGWINRHYAGYENNCLLAWDDGQTSFSVNETDNKKHWKYMKYAEEDQ
jgi:hypothetical protein